jgi:S1/P1 Nuclease
MFTCRGTVAAAVVTLGCMIAMPARAWGHEGHHTVGAIADRLLAGTHASSKVQSILGGLSLEQAAVWADCAKGVDPAKNYAYTAAGRFAECAIFETPELEAEMSDFVRRNDTNCVRKPTEESCHKQYHYTDVAIQRPHYRLGAVGTRNDDIVAAVGAAVLVLQGGPAPAPFDIKTPREALLLLTHYVGDIHQPLHVGAIYLDAKGKRVDPDRSALDPATETRGGNEIITVSGPVKKHGANLHHTWDEIPAIDIPSHVDAAWIARAKAVPHSAGAVAKWPGAWANGTLTQAKTAFSALKFEAGQNNQWTVVLPSTYPSKSDAIKRRQLTLAGARLAQLLQAVWP